MFSNFTIPNIHNQPLLNYHPRVSSRNRTYVRTCFAINSCALTFVTCCTLSPYTCFECVSISRCWLRLHCWTNNRKTKYETRVARSSETKVLLPPGVIRAYRKNGQARKLWCTSPWVTFKIGVGFCRTQRRTNHVVDRASSRRRRRDAHKTGWTKSRRVRAKVYNSREPPTNVEPEVGHSRLATTRVRASATSPRLMARSSTILRKIRATLVLFETISFLTMKP